jgi:hypothetical protein
LLRLEAPFPDGRSSTSSSQRWHEARAHGVARNFFWRLVLVLLSVSSGNMISSSALSWPYGSSEASTSAHRTRICGLSMRTRGKATCVLNMLLTTPGSKAS